MAQACVLATLGDDPHTQGLFRVARIAHKAHLAAHVLPPGSSLDAVLAHVQRLDPGWLGFSYRLSPAVAVDEFRRCLGRLAAERLLRRANGTWRRVALAGLPETMHAVAETGIAAHWLYKVDAKDGAATADPQRLGAMWLQSLIDIQDETRDAAEFLEHVKIDLFPDAVYVFTPKSKILALPRGATPVDFAYAIHSDIGDHCVAARVNGEAVALRTELRSGDVVEIVTAPGAHPNPAWLNQVRTGRARSMPRCVRT